MSIRCERYKFGWGCDGMGKLCCYHMHINMIFVFIFVGAAVLSALVMLQQCFWDRPRRRKRFYERPPSDADYNREHAAAEGRFPSLAKVIDEQEEKEKKAGLDPKRKRNLNPDPDSPSSFRLVGSQKGAPSSSQKGAAASSSKQQPKASQIGPIQGKSGKEMAPIAASLMGSGIVPKASGKGDGASIRSQKGLGKSAK